MTAKDFYLLFAAFAGFVGAPALLVWGLLRLWPGRSPTTPGPGQGPDKGPDKGPSRKALQAPERQSDAEYPRPANSEFADPRPAGRPC